MTDWPIELARSSQRTARAIAFYLPQFHPIPENNTWWGPGFTEWTNVAKARPLFRGHQQPRLPRDLGFYDLRVEETREAQADLARESGIEGFCYWHYWFGNGRRILERPFNEVLASGKPDFPFSLAWANQSWTGIWHGAPKTTLIRQEYPGREDEAAHFNWARKAFEDPRYQCVDGRPIFVVFAPHDLPDARAFTDHWRELAHRSGFPGLYLVAISNRYAAGVNRYESPLLDSFDAVTPLTPHDYLEDLPKDFGSRLGRRVATRNFGPRFAKLTKGRFQLPARYDYADVVAKAMHDMPDDPRFLPGVLPGWDNTPRSGPRGVIFENGSPELFEQYLRKAVTRLQTRRPQEAIVFVKAWNEWAEGNYVEPDMASGHGYLDVLRRVLREDVREAHQLQTAEAST